MKKTLMILIAVGMLVSGFAGRLQITNSTGGYDIWYVYISPSDSDTWGNDWLGASEIISSGSTKTFTVSDGLYDVRLVDEDGDDYTVWDMPISGTVTWNVTLADLGENYWRATTPSGSTATVTIFNNLENWDIYYIYCDPSTDDYWGEDRLGSSILRPNRSFSFDVPANNYYDIKLVDVDGDSYTLWEVYIGSEGLRWDVDLTYLD